MMLDTNYLETQTVSCDVDCTHNQMHLYRPFTKF
jgi:hypothetical protein